MILYVWKVLNARNVEMTPRKTRNVFIKFERDPTDEILLLLLLQLMLKRPIILPSLVVDVELLRMIHVF